MSDEDTIGHDDDRILAAEYVLSLLPAVDWAGHLGGFLFGFVLGLAWPAQALEKTPRPGQGLRMVAAVASAGLFLAGLAVVTQRVWQTSRWMPASEIRAMTEAVERGEFDKLYDGFLKERYDAGERPLMMMNHPKTFRLNEEFLTGSWDQIFDVNLQEIPNNSQRNKKFNDYGLDDYSPLRELLPSWIDGTAMPDREIVRQTLENVRFASEPYARLMEVTMGRGNEFGEEDARNPSMSEDEEGLVTRRVKVHSDYDYYLLGGFKLAPVSNHDNHFANWGTGHTSRTGVVARKLDKKGLLDSLDRRAVFASEDQNLALRFYANDRVPMGSEMVTTKTSVNLDTLIEDPDYDGPYTVTLYKGTIGAEAVEELQTVTLSADGWLELNAEVEAGQTHFFYVEILEDGADRMAWSAPIWVEAL